MPQSVRSIVTAPVIAAILLSIAGCDRAGPDAPSASAADAALTAPTAEVTQTRAALPARFSAAWPTTPAAMQAWFDGDPRFPPRAFVVDALAHGTDSAFEALTHAAAQVSVADAEAWARQWHHLLVHPASDAFCTRAAAVLDAPPSTLRMSLVGPYASHCAGPDALDRVLRADTPDWAVVAAYAPWREPAPGTLPYNDRLAAILRAALDRGDRVTANEAASALAYHPDPAARAALATLRASSGDVEWVKYVDGITRSVDASRRDTPAPTTTPPAELANRKHLATQLKAVGFDRVDIDGADVDDAAGLLVAAGHAYWFDVETGMFPNEHDSLLRSLAGLIAPTLDGVVFEEVAPHRDDAEGDYVLRAYVDGWQLETPAENLGDWYNVDAVLRLLDAVLTERNASQRFVALDTGDQTAIVVAATPEVLSAAFQSGLLTPGDPDAAEEIGKAFERKVLERLGATP